MELPEEVAAAVGRTWLDASTPAPWAVLEALVDAGPRLGGTAGERRAASVVAEALEEAGVDDVTHSTFPTQAWTRGSCSLRLDGDDEVPATALPYAPAADVTAPLVDVGDGLPREIRRAAVEGCVVLASTTTPAGSRFVHRMEKYGTAVDAGARGFVFANHTPGQLCPTGTLRYDAEAPVPGVGVSHESGERLRAHAADGGRVTLRVDADTTRGESRNVGGRLGPETERELLLLAHYDAHDVGEGALDNGCGVAVVVGAAALLAEMTLGCRVRVVAVGCEETGLVGSEHLAATADVDRVAGVVNVDGAGRFRDLVAMTHASEDTRAVAESVAESVGHPIAVKSQPHPFSDQWPFVRRGVPALQLHADSGERGRGWTHTAADTRDKVDARTLREHAILTALLVRALADRVGGASDGDDESTSLTRLDTDRLRRRFERADYEPGMRAAGIWPDEWA